jgi:hypothetical protein
VTVNSSSRTPISWPRLEHLSRAQRELTADRMTIAKRQRERYIGRLHLFLASERLAHQASARVVPAAFLARGQLVGRKS